MSADRRSRAAVLSAWLNDGASLAAAAEALRSGGILRSVLGLRLVVLLLVLLLLLLLVLGQVSRSAATPLFHYYDRVHVTCNATTSRHAN